MAGNGARGLLFWISYCIYPTRRAFKRLNTARKERLNVRPGWRVSAGFLVRQFPFVLRLIDKVKIVDAIVP